MDKTLIQFEKAREDFITALEMFPVGKWEEKLFGDWNLKEVVAHFSAWDRFFTACIDAVRTGKEVEYWGNINEFNAKAVTGSNKLSWEKILEDFKKSGEEFINVCRSLPENLQDKKIWLGKGYTPAKLLKVNIHHYQNEQFKRIKRMILQ